MGPGDVVAQRFELGAVAGAGAFGRVFRALDRETGRTVALKVLEEARPEVVDRFRREITLLASISHPHVVGHVASGVDGSRYAYLAMDWLEERLTDRPSLMGDPIPGAHGGRGWESARQYAADGWTVHGTARHPDAATALAELGPSVHVHGLEIGEAASIEALADELAGIPIDGPRAIVGQAN